MTVRESIKTRKAIRSYSGEPLRHEQAEQIRRYIATLPQPLGGKAKIDLMSSRNGLEPSKLGTYGMISGAVNFLALRHNDAPFAGVNAGYLFEQVMLYCTSLGLGTCWLGATFNTDDFAAQIKFADNETLRIVSPVGNPAGKGRILDKLIKAGAGSNKRKPFTELFFSDRIGNPLPEECTYHEPLEMVRLAPSARNAQPWRIIVTGDNVHFYYTNKSKFNDIDLGIALCHFGETCREMAIGGKFVPVGESGRPDPAGLRYCISWQA